MEKTFYKKSLVAKLVLERNFALQSYQEIKDLISTYKEIKTKLSFDHELITYKGKSIGMIRLSRKNIILAVNLDPSTIDSKINIIDASNIKSYSKYPTKLIINNKKNLNNSLKLLKKLFKEVNVISTNEIEVIDYSKVYYERTFLELFKQGYIKQYIKNSSNEVKNDESTLEINEEMEEDIYHKVTFTAKLVWCAEYQADDLYIVNNVDNWDFSKAIKMEKVGTNTFKAINFFKDGTYLEFKICRKQDWNNVEKGIWKEEIVNHHYLIVNQDLEVEDLIHNFRID